MSASYSLSGATVRVLWLGKVTPCFITGQLKSGMNSRQERVGIGNVA